MVQADPSRPVPIGTVTLARSIGLQSGGGTGRLATTVDRLVKFKGAEWLSPDRLGVRTVLPRLSARQLERLEPAVRTTYQALASAEASQRLTAKAFPSGTATAASSAPAPALPLGPTGPARTRPTR
jgi:hypothetical protein